MFSGTSVVPIVVFFLAHWWGSVLMQTFFLHRYASHGMFRLGKGWERFFHFLTYVTQGSSYLIPSAYAYLHRAHHAYSDTEKDPHSPHFYKDAFSMMWETKKSYSALVHKEVEPEERFNGHVPVWPALDRFGDSTVSRLGWGAAYSVFYLVFAPHWAFLFLLPVHFLMGPVHGAIVNWAGHKYGYRNFATRDMSRNVVPWDVITLGELFQNNHHRHAQSINFGQRWWELDPANLFVRVLGAVGIADLGKKQVIGVGIPSVSPADAE